MFKQVCSYCCLLNEFLVLFIIKQIFKNTTQRSIPRLDSYEWQDVWDSMGKNLGEQTPPMFWNFTPKKVHNPENLVKYLEKICCDPDNSRKKQITATCWDMAHEDPALLNTL